MGPDRNIDGEVRRARDLRAAIPESLRGEVPGKTLFCACVNRWKSGVLLPSENRYTHGADIQEARLHFLNGIHADITRGDVDSVEIVAIAPSIGRFVDDNQGKLLSL